MDEQGYRFGVGVLVVASLVIAVILILFFGAAPNFFAQRYLVTIRFEAAPGVATDTPVRKNGVQIGRVKSVRLLEDSDGVDLSLELDSQYTIRAKELPRIATGSLITGDAVVEFVSSPPMTMLERFDGTGGSPQDGLLDDNELQLASTELRDGDFLAGGIVAPEPLDALLEMQQSFGTTLVAIETAGNQVTALATDVRRIIGGSDGELQRITEKAELTIENFNDTLDSVEELFRNENLKEAIDVLADRLPNLVDEAEAVMQQTEQTLAAYEDVGRAAEETVKNVTEFTKPLGEKGDQIVSDAIRTLNNADALLVDLRAASSAAKQVAERISNGQGTFAKLVDDDELYFSVIRTLQNVETITRRIQPILEDARVFSDKVARDPSVITDLRGALTGRRGGIK